MLTAGHAVGPSSATEEIDSFSTVYQQLQVLYEISKERCEYVLFVTALRALVKSPFCPQRFTSVHSEATEIPPLAIFAEWAHTESAEVEAVHIRVNKNSVYFFYLY